MGVHKGVYDLHKEGSRDAQRHQEKLKKAFKEKLHDIISEENIIGSDGNRKIRVPIRSLDQYRFIFDSKKFPQTGQGDGDTEKGDIVHREKGENGEGDKAGNSDGEDMYEAEIDLDDLVEMMMEDLSLPRLDPKKKSDITVPEEEWTEVAKRGSLGNIHKTRTIKQNMTRNAARTGKAYFGDITQDDLRYKSWRTIHKPITSAVVIAMMDTSGSMYTEKKYLARAFFFWMVQFLRHKYQEVEIVFISHTASAKEVTEDDFFHKTESGGTVCSSAYKLANDIVEKRYDPSIWNIFAFHFSDGEAWGDEDECIKQIEDLCKTCNMVGYGEIKPYDGWGGGLTTLYRTYEEGLDDPKFVQAMLHERNDVYKVLKTFFSEEMEEVA